MALLDVINEIKSEDKGASEPKKKNVSFDIEEWKGMEARHGKSIDPAHVKKMVLGVFEGKYTITANKASK